MATDPPIGCQTSPHMGSYGVYNNLAPAKGCFGGI